MENKVTTISINTLSQKESKAGKPFMSLRTNLGTFMCWDADLFKIFTPGHIYDITYTELNNFRNIVSATQKEGSVETVKPAEFGKATIKEARASKDVGIYTSYVKDLVINGMELEKAIQVIKDARQAFS